MKQKERAERNRRFREKRRREEKDETQWTAPGEDARDGKGEEWERDKEGGKDEEAYDEFEARKELMQQMNLTRPPGKKKSALKQQQFNYQTNNTFTTEGEEGERKMGDNDDEDEEKEMYDEDEKDISAALLPQSPLLLSSSNGKALGNSKSIERARNDATSNIQHFARVKQLSKATQTFRNLVKNQRVNPSVYTYCALLNAYANAGRTKDIEIILRRMVTETKYKEEEAEAEEEEEEEEEEEISLTSAPAPGASWRSGATLAGAGAVEERKNKRFRGLRASGRGRCRGMLGGRRRKMTRRRARTRTRRGREEER